MPPQQEEEPASQESVSRPQLVVKQGQTILSMPLEDVPMISRMDPAILQQQYTEEELQGALTRIYRQGELTKHVDDNGCGFDHLYGYNDPNHQLSMLQKVTATVFLDYEHYQQQKDAPSLVQLEQQAAAFVAEHGPLFNLQDVIQQQAPRMALAAEFKRASPSKGDLVDPSNTAAGHQAVVYAHAGADIISCLTEPRWFKGTLQDLTHVRLATMKNTTTTPTAAAARQQRPAVLRKDFITTEYQIAEAVAAGADTILLIVAVLPLHLLQRLMAYSRRQFPNLEPLVEVHTDAEVHVALQAGARVLGVNNRNLHTFQLDLGTTERVAALLLEQGVSFRHGETTTVKSNSSSSLVLCALSGMSTCWDVDRFRRAGVGMCLIGESLMRASDPAAAIASLCLDPADFLTAQPPPSSNTTPATTAAACGAYTAGTQLIKICGITQPEDAVMACRAGANLIGVIFAEQSKRRVRPAQAIAIVQAVRNYGERSAALDFATAATAATAPPPLPHLAQWATTLARVTRQRPAVVGVFQNQEPSFVQQMVRECGLDLVQLHGHEGMSACRDCGGVPVLRVVDMAVDPTGTTIAPDAVEEQLLKSITNDPAAILLDTAIKGAGGGTGVAFDWSMAERLQAAGLPVLIAGGLTPESVRDCVGRIRPFGVDVSSGVEPAGAPGVKDHDKVREFVQGARAAAVEASKGF